jgi:hypothetical protein
VSAGRQINPGEARTTVMAPVSKTTPPPPTARPTSHGRLQQVVNHMASSKSSAFQADVVPQAPEGMKTDFIAIFNRQL